MEDPVYGLRRGVVAAATPFWPDAAPRCVVGAASGRLRAPVRVHRLHNVGSPARKELLLRAVSFALLFAGAIRRFSSRVVRRKAGLVARVDDLVAGAADSSLSGAVSP